MGMTGEQAYALAKKLIEESGGGGGTVDAYTKAQTDNLLNQKVDKEVGKGLFSGSYNDLTDVPTVPTKTSELQNDSGYMTEQAVSDEVNELNSNLDALEFSEVAGGKNKFDFGDKYGYEDKYQLIESVSDKSLSMKTRNYGATVIYRNKKLENLGETSISFSSTSTGGVNARLYFKLFDANGNMFTSSNCNFPIGNYNDYYNGWYYEFSSFGDLSITFTMPTNVAFWNLGLGANADTGHIITFTNIQVEQGRTVTPYEPYIPSVKMLAEEVNAQNESLDDYGLDNKFDGQLLQGYYNSGGNGEFISNSDYVCNANIFSCKAGDTIKLNVSDEMNFIRILFYSNGFFLTYIDSTTGDFSAPKNATHFNFTLSKVSGGTIQSYGRISVYVNNSIDELKNDLTDEWTSKTYSVGDYCIYKNSMWRCLVDNSEKPSEGLNWTRVTIGSELKRIISMINK